MEHDKEPAEIVVDRPTGPRVAVSEPLSLGQLALAKGSKVSKSVISTAVVGVSATLAVLTRHKFATTIGASAVMAVATHLIVASMMMGLIGDHKPTIAAYAGPGDVQSGALAFWSCRAYSAAKAGTKAYRIQRASDSTQTDINSLGSGLCDTATVATFCAATTCKYVTWYDQSGALACTLAACDLIGTSANLLTQSSLNGWPCIDNSGLVGIQLDTAGTMIASQTPNGVSYLTIGKSQTSSQYGTYLTDQTDSAFSDGAIASKYHLFFAVDLVANATDGAFHAVIGNANGASSSIYVDGVQTGPSNAGTNSINGRISVGNSLGSGGIGGIAFKGQICEAAIYPAVISSPASMNSNMHSSTNGWNF